MSNDEKKLSESYGFEESEELTRSPFKSDTAPYVRNNEKATDYKSTGYVLTIFGGVGIVVIILTLVGVIPEFFGNPYLSYGVMFALFSLFLVMGILSLRSAGLFEKKAKSDHSLEKRILDYVYNELKKDEIDSSADILSSDAPETLYFKRSEVLKKIITEKFVNIDPDFVDNLIDEKIYDEIFDKSDDEKE
mgnify:CR=1 FL=1